MVNIYVGNTDNDWFDFLSSLSDVDEVNFWKPSTGNFNAIGEGERFAFRLKSPRNKIGGFGTLAKSSTLPIQLAWEAFGTKNGVPSLGAFVTAISKFRPNERVTPSTFIVCRILVEPVFLPPHLWFDVPSSWAGPIVQGKTYSGGSDEGAALWRNLEAGAVASRNLATSGFGEEEQARFGEPIFIRPRLGQGAFRVAITELYHRQCALTDGKVLPALDAAHIRPYAEGGTHTKSNGILLRKDIHSVFDAGYATIDTDYRFVVSDKVRDVFHNGNEYRRLHGTVLRLPADAADRPDREMLSWHNQHRYLGG
jgi:putative restriction endonuclease